MPLPLQEFIDAYVSCLVHQIIIVSALIWAILIHKLLCVGLCRHQGFWQRGTSVAVFANRLRWIHVNAFTTCIGVESSYIWWANHAPVILLNLMFSIMLHLAGLFRLTSQGSDALLISWRRSHHLLVLYIRQWNVTIIIWLFIISIYFMLVLWLSQW